jgi:iron(II)-dependent oxidoreductase
MRARLLFPVLAVLLALFPATVGADEEPEIPPGFIYVPGGKFLMGTDSDEPTNESPMHEVVVEPYLISRHEVSNGQYAKFIEAKGYETEKFWSEEGWKWRQGEYGRALPVEWEELKKQLGDEFDRHPVVGVCWYEADAYARWAGRRLPTEVEWERAARGTDARLFPWGNEFEHGLRRKPEGEAGRTYPVGANPADVSPVGAFDMGGNVSEWTATTFGPYPGTKYESRYWGEDARRKLKVARGGSWRYIDDAREPVAHKCRVTYRLIQVRPAVGCPFVGFRLAADL